MFRFLCTNIESCEFVCSAASPTCHTHTLQAGPCWAAPGRGRWGRGRREWRAILEAIGGSLSNYPIVVVIAPSLFMLIISLWSLQDCTLFTDHQFDMHTFFVSLLHLTVLHFAYCTEKREVIHGKRIFSKEWKESVTLNKNNNNRKRLAMEQKKENIKKIYCET